MARMSHIALLGLALVAFSQLASATSVSDVYGVERDPDTGKSFLMHEGVRYDVYEDPEQNKVWFMNMATQEATWNDPRTGGEALTMERIKNINVNVAPAKKGSKTTIYVVVMLPVLLFTAALFGRIYYLHVNYPELLWPTKERKQRARSNQKFKPQKARGKMNQDGKGGRSANS